MTAERTQSASAYQALEEAVVTLSLEPGTVVTEQALCERLGVAPAETIAIGDSLNDLELLRACGLGVAMGNAHRELLAAADLVIGDRDSDAIAEFLLSSVVRDGALY